VQGGAGNPGIEEKNVALALAPAETNDCSTAGFVLVTPGRQKRAVSANMVAISDKENGALGGLWTCGGASTVASLLLLSSSADIRQT
jgi:hypothetical protein